LADWLWLGICCWVSKLYGWDIPSTPKWRGLGV
jgi:hypothetical protein